MKAFILMGVLLVSFSSNLMAATDKTCYPFHPNQAGYNRICVTLEKPLEEDTKAAIEVYRNERLVNTIAGKRFYTPQQQDCTTFNFCFRRYASFKIVSEVQDLNGIKVEVFLRNKQRPTTCLSGKVVVAGVELDVECPRTSWEEI